MLGFPSSTKAQATRASKPRYGAAGLAPAGGALPTPRYLPAGRNSLYNFQAGRRRQVPARPNLPPGQKPAGLTASSLHTIAALDAGAFDWIGENAEICLVKRHWRCLVAAPCALIVGAARCWSRPATVRNQALDLDGGLRHPLP